MSDYVFKCISHIWNKILYVIMNSMKKNSDNICLIGAVLFSFIFIQPKFMSQFVRVLTPEVSRPPLCTGHAWPPQKRRMGAVMVDWWRGRLDVVAAVTTFPPPNWQPGWLGGSTNPRIWRMQWSLIIIKWYYLQSSTVTMRSSVVRYCVNVCRNSGRISIRCWIPKDTPYLALTGVLWEVFCE